MTIRFENPPPRKNQHDSRPDHAAIARTLKERPGAWAMVIVKDTGQGAAKTAHTIRVGVQAPYRPSGSFEAVARSVNGEHRVYARYVGLTLPSVSPACDHGEHADA